MKRLAVIPSDPIEEYIHKGYSKQFLRDYYNPCQLFDEVFLLSNLEKDQSNLLGMKVFFTKPRDLAKRIKELNIDIVRAYGGNWACAYACENKVPGVPVVVSVHDSSPQRLYDSIKKADIVLGMSKIVKDLVATKFDHKDRIWILPNRVNFNFMLQYPKDQLEDLEKKYAFPYKILHVGRLSEEKNLDTLIKAMPILGKDYCVISVGQGDLLTYKRIAKEKNVDDRIFFIDAVPNEDLGRYYSWCSCMCTPSRREGFGVVFVEALACGAVVITSDIAPMNEYIQHGHNGLLVKEFEDPRSLAQMIQKGCNDGQLRSKVQSNARDSVSIFEKEKVDRQEVDIYKKILHMKIRGDFDSPSQQQLYKVQDSKIAESYGRALAWVKQHTLPRGGIIVNTEKPVPYLEVTGYFIPTLIECNEQDLARSYAVFLANEQQPDGSYLGPDDKKYVFDTGQALRGLNLAYQYWPEFKSAALKAADYIMTQMGNNGRINFVYDEIPEYIHVYVLPALYKAGELFDRPEYIQACQRSIEYYKRQRDVLDPRYLTHFLAYILDGFIEMGENDFVRPIVEQVFSTQGKDGRIRANTGVHWVCSVGIAQMAIVGYKLGIRKPADRAMSYLSSLQNSTGGFYGSYGLGAKYFPKAEISWANKFFLDAVHIKNNLN